MEIRVALTQALSPFPLPCSPEKGDGKERSVVFCILLTTRSKPWLLRPPGSAALSPAQSPHRADSQRHHFMTFAERAVILSSYPSSALKHWGTFLCQAQQTFYFQA